MPYNRITVLPVLFLLAGCIYEVEPMPRVVAAASSEAISQEPRMPADMPLDGGLPAEWVPAKHLERRWSAVVIHHSGTETGNAAIFDKWHREGNHWEGVGYDFVIGNGSNSGDGEVEVTFRWRHQMTGAHCGGTKDNWANRYAVGICLVGDFDRSFPTQKQMRSLVRLVRFLQSRYGISRSRIFGHNTTPGARVTNCPGHNFSVEKLRRMLDG